MKRVFAPQPSYARPGVAYEVGQCYTYEDDSAWVFMGAYWVRVA